MSNRLMITAAAVALIAGAGLANAQGTGAGREGGSGGSAAQQTQGAAPSSGNSAAPTNRDAKESSGPPGMKSTQSEEKGGKNQRAQKEMKGGTRDEKSAQDTKGEKSKGMSSQNEKGAAGKDMQAEGRQDRNGNMNADKSGTENRSQTVGQAGGAAKLSTEQRTRITSVIRDQHVAPLNNANFSIAVGTRIPRDVSFHPLPTEIVSIYPEWRGYNYILVRDQILVVDPRTFEIVAILDA